MKRLIFLFLISVAISYPLKAQTRVFDVYTPKGNQVVAYITPEGTQSERLSSDNYYAQNWGDALQIIMFDGLSSTQRLNCHGYAWHYTEGGLPRWIGLNPGNTDPDIYMSDGSYALVSQMTYPGKVFWERPGDHSAIVNAQFKLVSKWNKFPLMVHDPDYGPNWGSSNLKYYVKSPGISGPGSVPCSGTVSFSIPTQATTTFSTPAPSTLSTTWAVSSNLQIVSQTATSLTVRRVPNNSFTTGTVYVKLGNDVIDSKVLTMDADTQAVTAVYPTATSIQVGETVHFTATPHISANFEWRVTVDGGGSYEESVSGNYNSVTFYGNGTYHVECRINGPCGPTSWVGVWIYVY